MKVCKWPCMMYEDSNNISIDGHDVCAISYGIFWGLWVSLPFSNIVCVTFCSVQSEAQQFEMAKVKKIGGKSREDRLREGANLQIKLGNIQRYCEIMVELEEVRRMKLLSFLFCYILLKVLYWENLITYILIYIMNESMEKHLYIVQWKTLHVVTTKRTASGVHFSTLTRH